MTYAYFNALVARPDYWKSYSLRDPAQLMSRRAGGYAQGGLATPLNITYDEAMDAAKVVVPEDRNSLPNQIRLPVGTEDGHRYLITWDARFGAEYRYAHAAIRNYKTFQFDCLTRLDRPRYGIWVEINNAWIGAPDDAGLLHGRYYAGELRPAGPGATTLPNGFMGPQANPFVIQPETWTRYWAVFDQKASDPDWTRYSLWVADETRDPVSIFDQLAITALGGIEKFWLEFNTSTDAVVPGRGPLTSYVRNVWMGRDVADVPSLLVQP